MQHVGAVNNWPKCCMNTDQHKKRATNQIALNQISQFDLGRFSVFCRNQRLAAPIMVPGRENNNQEIKSANIELMLASFAGHMPRSVIREVTSLAGVTSKA